MEKNSHFKGLRELGPLTVLRADLDEEGSFDDAVAGCDYAFLVAASVNIAAGEDLEVRRLASRPIACFLFVMYILSPDDESSSNLERADRACRPGNAERAEVVREGRHGEARGPDLVGGRGLHQARAAGRRARPGRGLLVRRRAPQSREADVVGVLRVQGAPGEGGGQVRGGARHQPRHRLPGHHLGRGAVPELQHQRPEQPRAPVR